MAINSNLNEPPTRGQPPKGSALLCSAPQNVGTLMPACYIVTCYTIKHVKKADLSACTAEAVGVLQAVWGTASSMIYCKQYGVLQAV